MEESERRGGKEVEAMKALVVATEGPRGLTWLQIICERKMIRERERERERNEGEGGREATGGPLASYRTA